MKKLPIALLAAASLPVVMTPDANAAITITDADFNNTFTDIGKDTLTQADSANFDKWVNFGTGESIPRIWEQIGSGGNPGGYADGAFTGNNYNRTLFQAVTDSKANTGLMDLTFDLNLSNGGASNGPLTVSVWGVETLSGASFSLSLRAQAGVTEGDATVLGTQQFSTDTTGWEGQAIQNIDFGTGYDLVVIGFWSAQYDQTDPDIVGIDNVAIAAVPESSTSALLVGAFALGAFRRRRK